MRRYIVLLLITGIVWTQTDYDKLVLKDGEEYLGEYLITNLEMVYFKTQNEVAPLMRHKREVQTLQLKDGTFVINNRPRSELTIEEKAVYDAKENGKKWFFYTPIAVISFGGSFILSTAAVAIVAIPFDENYKTNPYFMGAAFGLTGYGGFRAAARSYKLFSKSDKYKLDGINAKNIELYKETYSKELKRRKLINIIKFNGVVALTSAAVVVYAFHNFSLGGGSPNFSSVP